MSSSDALRYLSLAGPTACGKTAAALHLATRFPIEIISVDSALVYRGMDIGTAKPTAGELAQVPHHLIDIIDPAEAYSAAQFVRQAGELIEAIRGRGRLPVLVGGTMLYFKALFDGMDDLPAAQPALRAQIEAEAAQLGWPGLHAQLALVDPVTAARLSPNDSQRIGRALEVFRATGQPLSSFHSQRFEAGKGHGVASDTVLLSLEPQERAWLHARAALRFDLMLQQGFLDEVHRLRQRGDLHLELPSMRCVGYRQAWEVMDEVGARSPAELDAKAITRITETGVAATRQLAKRQVTWLRGMAQREVLACDQGDPSAQVLDRVTQLWPRFGLAG